jgi:hypothetical protein
MGVALFAWQHTLSSAVGFSCQFCSPKFVIWGYAYAFMCGFGRHSIGIWADRRKLRAAGLGLWLTAAVMQRSWSAQLGERRCATNKAQFLPFAEMLRFVLFLDSPFEPHACRPYFVSRLCAEG